MAIFVLRRIAKMCVCVCVCVCVFKFPSYFTVRTHERHQTGRWESGWHICIDDGCVVVSHARVRLSYESHTYRYMWFKSGIWLAVQSSGNNGMVMSFVTTSLYDGQSDTFRCRLFIPIQDVYKPIVRIIIWRLPGNYLRVHTGGVRSVTLLSGYPDIWLYQHIHR